MLRSLTRIKRLLLALLISITVAACDRQSNDKLELHGSTMGTSYTVKAIGLEKHHQPSVMHEKIDEILVQVNASMSTYQADSELSRFNRGAVDKWVPVSARLFEVLSLSFQVSEQTQGSFDISVGPLVDLWGFGAGKSSVDISGDDKSTPSFNEIISAQERVGYRYLQLDAEKSAIKKTRAISLDLSAIAKGYAVDQVATYLLDLGLNNFLVEIGGEVRGNGSKAKNSYETKPWRIAIESPVAKMRSVHRIVNIESVGLATSGDYRNYFEHNGKRYSHTIDPVSGRPVTHALASVTVIHPQAALADAYATALMVMGLDKGKAFAEQLNLAVFMLSYKSGDDDNPVHEWMTPQFEQYIVK